jgi:hypothetical protein
VLTGSVPVSVDILLLSVVVLGGIIMILFNIGLSGVNDVFEDDECNCCCCNCLAFIPPPNASDTFTTRSTPKCSYGTVAHAAVSTYSYEGT